MAPELAQFESAHQKDLNIVNVDADKEKAKLDAYPAAKVDLDQQGGIPYTALVDSQGKLVKSWVGAMTRDELEKEIQPLLKTP